MISSGRLGAVALLVITTAAAGMSSAAPAPEPTTSHYLVLTGDARTDDGHGYDIGCAAGRSGVPGLRMLLFGAQERGSQLRPPGTGAASPATRVPVEHVPRVAGAWIDGFIACRRYGTKAILALGVSNKSDAGADAATAGAAWAEIVERAGRLVEPAELTITGAFDAEPAWSAPGWAREWVRAFTAGSPRALYSIGSADGCPDDRSKPATCSNGWTVADLHYIATGAADTVAAAPQIYRTDGIQARQWASISSWGARNGVGPLRVAAALSQQQACTQRAGCGGRDNSPMAARAQLVAALDHDPDTRLHSAIAVTDLTWAAG